MSRSARGYILPPSTAPGNPGESELLPGTLASLDTLGFQIRELALDGGFGKHTTQDALDASDQTPTTVYLAGRQSRIAPHPPTPVPLPLRRGGPH